LIPLCHPILLTHIHVDLTPLPEQNQLYCQAIVETVSQTGVEMEALTAVQIALLTVYDMCKAVDRGMTIEKVQLTKKSGGQSGVWERD
jgi:cyclic pyranopterin phosphate synthase